MSSAKARRGKKRSEAEAVVPLSAGQAGDRAWHLVGVLAGGTDPRGFEHGVPGVPVEAADPLIERIVVAEQLISWARSQQLTDIAAMGDLRSVIAPTGLSALDQAELELGAALVLSRRQASQRVDDAVTMVQLPRVAGLLRSGLICQARAEAISRSMTEHLQPSGDPLEDQSRWERVEAKVTARAPSRTAAMLRSDVARAALTVDPAAAERRRVKRAEDRDVRSWARPDGMAGIEALLTAESAAIIDTTLTLLADAQRDAAARAGTPDERTHHQRRADALTGVFAAIADGRPLRLHPTHRPPTNSDPAGPAEPGADRGGRGEGGVDESGRYIPECFVRPSHDLGDDGRDGNTACHAEPAEPAEPVAPAAVPAWWEPPHIPRQQRRRPHLVITIHASTLARHDDLPGELAGYGAITAQAARDLAKHCGSADLVVLDPPPGTSPDCTPACQPTGSGPPDSQHDPDPPPTPVTPVKPVTPVPYKPRDQVIRDVLARHRTCRAPGCTRPAPQCDLDHVIPYHREKRSCPCNLIPLCRRHHRLKTLAGWEVTLQPANPGEAAGTVEWTSPAGRHYTAEPPDQPGTPHW